MLQFCENRPETTTCGHPVECRKDECEHRDEAPALQTQPPGWLLRAWCKLVGSGSSAAVALARLV